MALRRALLGAALVLAAAPAFAEGPEPGRPEPGGPEPGGTDYGTFGAVFPIVEPSPLVMIMDRLAAMEGSGELEEMKHEMQATARARIRRPHPVAGIARSDVYASFEVDLSITLDRDLADHRGVVFAQAGTTINPLDHSRFAKRLVFVDGDDPEQVALALAVATVAPTKIVLVAGEPLTLTEEHRTLFYFDQQGVLSERLQVRAVPSVVSRGYPHMIVEEIPNESAEASAIHAQADAAGAAAVAAGTAGAAGTVGAADAAKALAPAGPGALPAAVEALR